MPWSDRVFAQDPLSLGLLRSLCDNKKTMVGKQRTILLCEMNGFFLKFQKDAHPLLLHFDSKLRHVTIVIIIQRYLYPLFRKKNRVY